MEKLSIQSLFHCKTGNSQVLDVNSIIGKKDESFDIKRIIAAKEERRKRLCNTYEKLYEKCVNKIDIANSLGKTDLLYYVPVKIKDVPEYNPKDCLIHIDKRIKSLYMDSHMVNNAIIFITWFYIEANIEFEKQKEIKINNENDNNNSQNNIL